MTVESAFAPDGPRTRTMRVMKSHIEQTCSAITLFFMYGDKHSECVSSFGLVILNSASRRAHSKGGVHSCGAVPFGRKRIDSERRHPANAVVSAVSGNFPWLELFRLRAQLGVDRTFGGPQPPNAARADAGPEIWRRCVA